MSQSSTFAIDPRVFDPACIDASTQAANARLEQILERSADHPADSCPSGTRCARRGKVLPRPGGAFAQWQRAGH